MLITLPVPPKQEWRRFDRINPEDLFPGGMKALAAHAFANPDDFGSFIADTWAELFDWGHEFSEDPRMIRHQRKLERQAFRSNLEFLLYAYYDEFWMLNKPIVLDQQYTVKRVASFAPIGAICLEVERGRTPRYPHCPGF